MHFYHVYLNKPLSLFSQSDNFASLNMHASSTFLLSDLKSTSSISDTPTAKQQSFLLGTQRIISTSQVFTKKTYKPNEQLVNFHLNRDYALLFETK